MYKRQALTFLKNCKLTHGRLVRWMLILQEYDLTTEYCRGKENVVADVLSRTDFNNNTDVDTANTYKIFIIKEVEGVNMKKLIHNLATEQEKDTELGKIITALNKIPNIPNKWEKHFSLYDKHLFHRTNEQG